MSEFDLLRNLGVLAVIGGLVFGGWLCKTPGRIVLIVCVLASLSGAVVWRLS